MVTVGTCYDQLECFQTIHGYGLYQGWKSTYIPVAETTVTLLFENLGGLRGSPKTTNIRGIKEFTPNNPQKLTQDVGRNNWAGRGSEPVGRRGPKSSPKVSPMTIGAPAWCPMLKMDPPKNGLDPPLNEYCYIVRGLFL